MKVIWTPEAEQDRIDVWQYIAADNPHAAAKMDELFSDAAGELAGRILTIDALDDVGLLADAIAGAVAA